MSPTHQRNQVWDQTKILMHEFAKVVVWILRGYLHGGDSDGSRKISNVNNTDPTILKNPCLSMVPLGCHFGKSDAGSEATEEATKEDGKEDQDQQEALTPGVPFGCVLYGGLEDIPRYINSWQIGCG